MLNRIGKRQRGTWRHRQPSVNVIRNVVETDLFISRKKKKKKRKENVDRYLFPHLFFCIPQAVKKLKRRQAEVFLKSLIRTPMETPKRYFHSTIGKGSRSIFETEELWFNRRDHKSSTSMSTSGLARARDFASLKDKSGDIFLRHKRPSLEKLLAVISLCYSTIASPSSYLPSLKSIGKSPSPKIYQKSLLLERRTLKYPRDSKPSALSFSISCSRSLFSRENFRKCFPKFGTDKPRKIFARCDSDYSISSRKIHRREFHVSAFPLSKSMSDGSSSCKKINEICKKPKPCERLCTTKGNVCRRETIKCDEQRDKKIEKKVADLKKTCLGKSKCELPRTIPPPKMKYAKVTCPPPKFVKPNPCPPIPKRFQKDYEPCIEIRQINGQQKWICVSPPLPKPPYGPVILCPCPPPRKLHPGPCPCYTDKGLSRPVALQPCPLKKKYPCPTGVHYCPPKPCNLKRGCEHKKKQRIS